MNRVVVETSFNIVVLIMKWRFQNLQPHLVYTYSKRSYAFS